MKLREVIIVKAVLGVVDVVVDARVDLSPVQYAFIFRHGMSNMWNANRSRGIKHLIRDDFAKDEI